MAEEWLIDIDFQAAIVAQIQRNALDLLNDAFIPEILTAD